jgi:hypothetical protein
LDQSRFVVFEDDCYLDQAGNMLPSVAGSRDSPLAERPFRDQFRGYGQLLTELERLFGRSSSQLRKLGLAPLYDRQLIGLQIEFGIIEWLNLLPWRFRHFYPRVPVPKQSRGEQVKRGIIRHPMAPDRQSTMASQERRQPGSFS